MRKWILGALLTVVLSASAPADKVYVCDSGGAVAYHADRNCRGLRRCTHEIVLVSESDAVKVYHHRKCRICY